MKYDRKSIMAAAWKIFRKGVESFAKALRMAWANAKARNAAKDAAGISEEVHSWSGWKHLGYEVAHGSKALFKATTNDPATKSGFRVVAYFGLSQVQPIEA